MLSKEERRQPVVFLLSPSRSLSDQPYFHWEVTVKGLRVSAVGPGCRRELWPSQRDFPKKDKFPKETINDLLTSIQGLSPELDLKG